MKTLNFYKLIAVSALCGAAAITACADKLTAAQALNGDGDTLSVQTALQAAKWASNVTVSFVGGQMRYQSNGIPNHARQAEYAVPNPGARGVPTEATAYAAADPTRAQTYDFQIPLIPKKATQPTSTSLGTIGMMISGAGLFNPYEGDGVTVAMANNFTVRNSEGERVAFLDSCNGHPTPMGEYHYHALPPCVTSMVDVAGGPSHIIGVAFDGYPIYGDRDVTGKQLTAADLDQCGGISSSTPEFPAGIYHYVLLNTSSASSSIRCFMGEVTITMRMSGM